MCNKWPNFQIGVSGVTGGLIGDTVVICGGYNISECYSLTSKKATLVTHMSVGRLYTASIVLNDNTLWVTGGRSPGGYNTGDLASTEYVTLTGTIIGPDLPMALAHHAMVAINSTCSMVIGGYGEEVEHSASTFYYDRIESEWITGPILIQGRNRHAAGIVTDEVTDEDIIVVTGGSYSPDSWFDLDSTEILQDGEWVQGKTNDSMLFFGKLLWYQNLEKNFLISLIMKLRMFSKVSTIYNVLENVQYGQI